MPNMSVFEGDAKLRPHSLGEPIAEQHLTDQQRLAQIGHEEQLERRFSLTALGCLCLCLMATWEALSTVVAAALQSGGAPCLFYN